MFNGEAVSFPSGAAVFPPAPNPASTTPTNPSNPTNQNSKSKFSRESFEEMKQSPGLKSGDMKDPLNFLDPLWSLKKKWVSNTGGNKICPANPCAYVLLVVFALTLLWSWLYNINLSRGRQTVFGTKPSGRRNRPMEGWSSIVVRKTAS